MAKRGRIEAAAVWLSWPSLEWSHDSVTLRLNSGRASQVSALTRDPLWFVGPRNLVRIATGILASFARWIRMQELHGLSTVQPLR